MDFVDFLIGGGFMDERIGQELKYSDLTGKVIGCAMKIHRHLGQGFPEIIYKRCLIIELKKLDINYLCEEERVIYYEGESVGKRRLDLLIENKVLIELKASVEIDKANCNQIINYLKIFDIEVGLTLNFGAPSLQFKRFVNSNLKKFNP